MAYYNVCHICGSNLDPGERCDCEEVKERQSEFLQKHIRKEKDGQLRLVFEEYEKTVYA